MKNSLQVLVILLIFTSCHKVNDKSDLKHLAMISSSPAVVLPEESSLINIILPDTENCDVIMADTSITPPLNINRHYIPIGKVYDISLNGKTSVHFGDKYAELHYNYNKEMLEQAGLIEEFMVFYYDEDNNSWEPVDNIFVNKDESEVIAQTSHFTCFVLTALSDPWTQLGEKIKIKQSNDSGNPSMAFDDTFIYIAWEEFDKDDYSCNIYVAKYDRSEREWISLGDSLNINKKSQARNPSIAINNSVPYVSWKESNGVVDEVFVKKWDRGEWTEVGHNLNVDGLSADKPEITFCKNKLFLIWSEGDNEKSNIYVKSWDGNSWTLIGDKININSNIESKCPTIASNGDTIYVAWIERSGILSNLFVKHWDGVNWIGDGGRLNVETNTSTWLPSIAAHGNYVYVAFQEYSITNYTRFVYVKQFDGTEWKILGDKINTISSYNASYPHVTLVGEKPLLAWAEIYNGKYNIFAKHWDGTCWVQDGWCLNIKKKDHTWFPYIGTNGVTFFVAFEQDEENGNSIYVKAGNWDESITSGPQIPMITKFNLLSSNITKDNNIQFEVEGIDDKNIIGWLITGNMTKPDYNDPGWKTVKPTSCYLDHLSYYKYILFAWAKDEDNNVSNPYYGIEVELENPVPGNFGLITSSKLQLNWTEAIDNNCLQEELRYQVFYSESDNIQTIDDIEQNGKPIGYWEYNINTKDISDEMINLKGTYYYNILVMDKLGNKSAYSSCIINIDTCSFDREPPSIVLPSDGSWKGPWVILGLPLKGELELKIQVDDSNGIKSVVHDASTSNVSIRYNSDNMWSIIITPQIDDGYYSFTVISTDNCSNSKSFTVTYQKSFTYVCDQFCVARGNISYSLYK